MIKSIRIYNKTSGELLIKIVCKKDGSYDTEILNSIYKDVRIEARNEDNKKIYFRGEDQQKTSLLVLGR